MFVSLACIVASGILVMALSANAQQHLMRDEALAYAGAAIEGYPPEVVVRRVISDSSTLTFYDDILNGRQPWPAIADTSTLLYYLARSEQDRFLSTFLRFSANTERKNPRDLDKWDMAVVGLVALAGRPEARNRLMSLASANQSFGTRLALSRILANRNSVAAREVLRALDTRDFPAKELERVRATLTQPAAP